MEYEGTSHLPVGRALKREQFMAWCVQLPAGCLVAMEACSSAHHWARKLRSLGLGARLIAANFVTPEPHWLSRRLVTLSQTGVV